MEFASEMVVRATLNGLKISEVATTLSPDGRSRPPHLRTWRDGWRHLKFLFLSSPKWLFFYPGCFLISLGLLIGSVLMRGIVYFGAVGLDVHTLLYAAAMILVGFQSVIFAILAETTAIQQGILPANPRIERCLAAFTLERGILVSLTLMGLGIWGSIQSLMMWRIHDFGHLNTSEGLRVVIPSVLSLVLGSHLLLSSFLLAQQKSLH